ncbi:uncharacterized protein LOC135578762 isoform X1 [Columba livia]|uniref:uncharacterized protein LOC135578762 isoform X1 n=1 Tax=Columba livia TaxID=8932 RepID=UPI0031BB7C77
MGAKGAVLGQKAEGSWAGFAGAGGQWGLQGGAGTGQRAWTLPEVGVWLVTPKGQEAACTTASSMSETPLEKGLPDPTRALCALLFCVRPWGAPARGGAANETPGGVESRQSERAGPFNRQQLCLQACPCLGGYSVLTGREAAERPLRPAPGGLEAGWLGRWGWRRLLTPAAPRSRCLAAAAGPAGLDPRGLGDSVGHRDPPLQHLAGRAEISLDSAEWEQHVLKAQPPQGTERPRATRAALMCVYSGIALHAPREQLLACVDREIMGTILRLSRVTQRETQLKLVLVQSVAEVSSAIQAVGDAGSFELSSKQEVTQPLLDWIKEEPADSLVNRAFQALEELSKLRPALSREENRSLRAVCCGADPSSPSQEGMKRGRTVRAALNMQLLHRRSAEGLGRLLETLLAAEEPSAGFGDVLLVNT